MITVTENAVKQLQNLLREQSESRERGLRVFVEAGGCAGMQYGMTFDEPKQGDQVVETDGVTVLIDEFSAKYLDGSTIDFSNELAGAGFRIKNPKAVRSCGCGTSFETSAEA